MVESKDRAALRDKLGELRMLRESGHFHHATYRTDGLWTGLWVYKKSPTGFRGYEPAFAFFKDDPDLQAAEQMCKGTGISFGAYGHG
jgi:hypothetical protein